MKQSLSSKTDMVATAKTKLNPNFVYEAQEFIVSAISKDFNNIDFSIAGSDSFVFEQEDPIGMAFYIFALLETGYVSQEFSSKTDDWKFWLENRLEIDIPTPYIDTELSAIGLITYALARQNDLPKNINLLLDLVERHFTATAGIYKNFFASVLVGLGTNKIDNSEQLSSKINNYINSQIKHNRENVFNDPKNLVVTYLWSKETSNETLTKLVRTETYKRFEEEDYLDRDIIYLAFILLEEIKKFSRAERRIIKGLVEESIRFIRDYTLENKQSLSDVIAMEFGSDISFGKEKDWDLYGYPKKPVLSRILLSIGFLIEQKYVNSPQIFNGTEQLLSKISSIISYSVVFFGIGVLIFWIRGTTGFFNNYNINFDSKEFLDYAIGLLKLFCSAILLAFTLALFSLIFTVSYYFIVDNQISHKEALKKGLALTLKWTGIPALIIGILIELIT